MAIEAGQILCFRTTGELCVVVGLGPNAGQVVVRRPCMTHENGIYHSEDRVFEFELETEEQHLRREAAAMLLKVKIQEEMQEAMDAAKKPKEPGELVN